MMSALEWKKYRDQKEVKATLTQLGSWASEMYRPSCFCDEVDHHDDVWKSITEFMAIWMRKEISRGWQDASVHKGTCYQAWRHEWSGNFLFFGKLALLSSTCGSTPIERISSKNFLWRLLLQWPGLRLVGESGGFFLMVSTWWKDWTVAAGSCLVSAGLEDWSAAAQEFLEYFGQKGKKIIMELQSHQVWDESWGSTLYAGSLVMEKLFRGF